QGEPCSQRALEHPGGQPCYRVRASACGVDASARRRGGRQKQRQQSHISSGGAGATAQRSAEHTEGEESHRGLGTDLPGRDGT
ncbi:hypothetical protein M9458_037231, partial [Cirrhinus mrigala]